METLVATIIAFAVVLFALSIGVLFGRPPLKGSCGGVAGGRCACGATSEDECRMEEAS